MKHLLNYFLDLIYKRKCAHCACAIQSGFLCKTCAKAVQNSPLFAQGIVNGYKIYSAYFYKDVIKSLIHSLKFNHNKEIASYIGKLSAEYLYKLKNEINLENAIIIPVPAHISHIKKRGYDNVYEIAKTIGNLLNIEVNNKALTRIKQESSQYKLTIAQRRKNLKDNFKLDNNFTTNKLIILFDDIVTTGATLENITGLFKERGINNLICLTFSKTKKF